MDNESSSKETNQSVFEMKGAFIIENKSTGQFVSKSHKLTKIPSQVLIFETYIQALEYCLDHKFNKPGGYTISLQNQLELL